MKTIPTILLAVCAAVILAPAASAQEAQDKTVKVRFRVFGWDDSPSDLKYAYRGKDAGLVILQDNRSVFYDYTGPAAIRFYRLKTGGDGKPIREIAARADLSKAGPWPLILLARNQAKPDQYEARVLRDDLISFPSGTYAFSNFSTTPITGSLGGQIFTLSPGEDKVLKGNARENGTTLFAALVKMEDSRKVPIYTNNWAIQPMKRTRVFIKASPESPSGLVSIRVVESTVFPPENDDTVSKAD